jgi:hypothetical protein
MACNIKVKMTLLYLLKRKFRTEQTLLIVKRTGQILSKGI